ncbi:unnamed protein product [marine sediment metagenome]|uniref:Uncharacterized protein n=1 Tax=marine sediment metagenome TaxID=412755 RepID=X1IT26_9ZZZZ
MDSEIYNLTRWDEKGNQQKIIQKQKELKEKEIELKKEHEHLYTYIPDAFKQYDIYMDNRNLLNKSKHKFFDEDEELGISDLSSEPIVMDSIRSRLLTTNESFEKTNLSNLKKKSEKVDLEDSSSTYLVDSSGGILTKVEGNYYLKEYINQTLKGFENKEIKAYTIPNETTPLIIHDKTYTMTIAPISKIDSPILDYEKPGKQDYYGYELIKISQEDYNKIKKGNTKKEFIEKGNLPEDWMKRSKDQLIYDYIIATKTTY